MLTSDLSRNAHVFDLSPNHHEFSWYKSFFCHLCDLFVGLSSKLSPIASAICPYLSYPSVPCNEVDFKISNKDDAGTAKGEFPGSAKVGDVGGTWQSPKRFFSRPSLVSSLFITYTSRQHMARYTTALSSAPMVFRCREHGH